MNEVTKINVQFSALKSTSSSESYSSVSAFYTPFSHFIGQHSALYSLQLTLLHLLRMCNLSVSLPGQMMGRIIEIKGLEYVKDIESV